MGMDLKPINPSPDAPRRDSGEAVWGRYNWAGWRWLLDRLHEWGLDTSEFSGCNNGDVISEETCVKVSKLIQDHLPEFDETDREWISEHIPLWATCGGYEQW